PLLIQMPILFGMYAAMSQLATQGLTLDQVTQNQLQPGQVVYAAARNQDPLPFNQFVLTRLDVVLQSNTPVQIDVDQNQSGVWHKDQSLLTTVAGLTLTP